jgi:tetratricopeptide (TPR) repeat protein
MSYELLHVRRYSTERWGMTGLRIALLILVCVICGATNSRFILAQHKTVTVDWKAELVKAKAGIEKDPKSAFWHNQAGMAYYGLGEFETAVKELKLASSLEPSNPINDYAFYALYKRKGMHAEQREVLLDALEKDPANPLGHFEFASILEREKHWADSLREYQSAKALVANVKGPVYSDSLGNAYDVDGVREAVDKAIDRVAKLSESAQHQQ